MNDFADVAKTNPILSRRSLGEGGQTQSCPPPAETTTYDTCPELSRRIRNAIYEM